MKPDEPQSKDQDQPVAYDTEGRPLYSHPAEAARPSAMVATQAVHMARPTEIEKPFVSDATKIKHDRSHQLYPNLNLSEGEYVIAVVRRHPIGLFFSLGIGLLFVTLALLALFNYDVVVQLLQLKGAGADISVMIWPIIMVIVLICLITYVAYYVYTNNKFFLTNESIIEHSQTTLFAKVEKSISLGSIEDASYSQTSMLQQLVNYGSIRLSTVGDETSYRYTFVADPKHHTDMLNSAVEAFKNGRPVVIN